MNNQEQNREKLELNTMAYQKERAETEATLKCEKRISTASKRARANTTAI